MVIDVLTRFVGDASIPEMPEAQTFIAFPSFLKGFAKSQHKSGAEMASLEEDGISSWSEFVQYLLRNYTQSPRIRSAIADFRTELQR